jgi:hypothetical protein
MIPHEGTPVQPPAAPARPALSSKRRRLVIALVAAVAVLGATGTAAFWYMRPCDDCGRGRSPILCPDPCTLPTFG